MRLSIGTRLVGGFLMLAALIGGISWMALSGLREVSRAYENATDEYARRATVELELQVALLDQVRAEKNYLLRGETVYLEEARRLGVRVRSARARLAAANLRPEEAEVLRRVDAATENLDRTFNASVPVRNTVGVEAADAALRGKAAAILADLDQLVQAAGQRAEQARLRALAQARRTQRLTVILVSIVTALAAGLGIALSLSVTVPLRRLQSQIKAIAVGGAPPDAPAIKGRDEVAQIALAFYETVQTAALLREMETRSKRLAALSTRVAKAQEEERERIARELHDGLGQALTAIKLDLRAAARKLLSDPSAAGDAAAKAERLTEETLDELRRMIFDLRPPALDHLGLVAALESYLRSFEQRFDVAVALDADGIASRLPFEVETALYRICQEALTNIAKHAQARNAVVRIRCGDEAVSMTISDDGCGFSTSSLSEGGVRGIGILSMERRAEDLGGSFQVASEIGRGTTIITEVPSSAGRSEP